MKIFNFLIPFASTAQYQGSREDGKEWSATVSDFNLSYQEGGHSFVAEGTEVTEGGLKYN